MKKKVLQQLLEVAGCQVDFWYASFFVFLSHILLAGILDMVESFVPLISGDNYFEAAGGFDALPAKLLDLKGYECTLIITLY